MNDALERRAPFHDVPLSAFDLWLRSFQSPPGISKDQFRRLVFDTMNGLEGERFESTVTLLARTCSNGSSFATKSDKPLWQWLSAVPTPPGVTTSWFHQRVFDILNSHGCDFGSEPYCDRMKIHELVVLAYPALDVGTPGEGSFKFTRSHVQEILVKMQTVPPVRADMTLSFEGASGFVLSTSAEVDVIQYRFSVWSTFARLPVLQSHIGLYYKGIEVAALSPNLVFLDLNAGVVSSIKDAEVAIFKQVHYGLMLLTSLHGNLV